MITNSRYISMLDSAASAYPIYRLPEEIQWWLPSEEQQTRAFIYGNTSAMYRLLFGDVLCLPRNQVFDSPVFFNIAEGLAKLNQKWLTISLETGLEPTPLMFVEEVAQQFLNPSFYLSSWPGLDQAQRLIIYDNIIRTGDFSEMLQSVGKLADQQIDLFLRQQSLLQYILEYLKLHPEALQKSCKAENKERKIPLYHRILEHEILEQLGGNAKILQEIPSRIEKGENINNRGILYKYIGEFKDARDKLREVIDQQYHYILAESVSNGKIDLEQGIFSRNTLSQQARQIEAGDAQYDSRGVNSIFAHIVEDKGAMNVSSMNWDDIAMVLNDDDFKPHLAKLRQVASVKRGEEFRDALCDHAIFLQEFIPGKVFAECEDITLTFWFIHLDKERNEKLVKIISGFFGPLQGLFEVTMDESFRKIQSSLNEKRKSALAGRIRDWLTPLIEKEIHDQT